MSLGSGFLSDVLTLVFVRYPVSTLSLLSSSPEDGGESPFVVWSPSWEMITMLETSVVRS